MNRWYRGPARACFFAATLLAGADQALATGSDEAAAIDAGRLGGGAADPAAPQWRMAFSPFTAHWRPSEEHRKVWAVALERQRPDGRFTGGSFFSNSFGQESVYAYVGERYTGFWGEPQLFAQWSAGVIWGYRGKYEDKLPLNTKGFAPGALVSLGWNFDRRSSVAAHLLGDAGVMLQMSYEFR